MKTFSGIWTKIFVFAFIFSLSSTNLLVSQEPQLDNLFTPIASELLQLSPKQQQLLNFFQRQPRALALNVVKLNIDALANKESLNLNLFGSSYVVTRNRIETKADNSFTWYGNISDRLSSILITVHQATAAGFITVENDAYNLRSLGAGLHAVVKVDPSRYPRCGNDTDADGTQNLIDPGTDQRDFSSNQVERIDLFKSAQELPSSIGDTYLLGQTNTIIKVLVVYTTAAKNEAGGDTEINTIIDNAILAANQSYDLSNSIPVELQLAHKEEILNYTENNNYGAEFDFGECPTPPPPLPQRRLVTDHLRDPADGYMDEVHDLRGLWGADIVVLLTSNIVTLCGEAYAIDANLNDAFCIVIWDCAAAGGNWSLAHEVGHLLGARHHNDDCNFPARYGHGNVLQTTPKVNTMMATSMGLDRIFRWSSPNVFWNGTATGDATDHDVARLLQEQAPTFANYAKEYTGTITTNTTLSGIVLLDNVTVTNNATLTIASNARVFLKSGSASLQINAGASLVANSGATIKFPPNTGLIVNGTLNVNGTSSSLVTFTLAGTSGDWEGIEFKTGASGTISYAVIEKVYNADGINILNASPTIEYTTIKDCLWGLNLSNANATIRYCTIQNNDEGVYDRYGAALYLNNTITDRYGALTDGNGIIFISADPSLFGNLLSDNVTGVTGTSATYAEFGSATQTGNNVIRNNGWGVHSNGTNTYLRFGEYNSWGGDNSIYSNTTWDAIALYSSWIIAEITWWGNPSGGNVYYDATSGVYDSFPLSSDPNQGMAPKVALLAQNAARGKTRANSSILTPTSQRNTQKGLKSPVFNLLQLRHLYRAGKATGFIAYLDSVASAAAGTVLGDAAKNMLALEYYLDGQYQNALDLAQENKIEFANTDYEKFALVVLFDTYLCTGLAIKQTHKVLWRNYPRNIRTIRKPNDCSSKAQRQEYSFRLSNFRLSKPQRLMRYLSGYNKTIPTPSIRLLRSGINYRSRLS